jgi:hypothetical protein
VKIIQGTRYNLLALYGRRFFEKNPENVFPPKMVVQKLIGSSESAP